MKIIIVGVDELCNKYGVVCESDRDDKNVLILADTNKIFSIDRSINQELEVFDMQSLAKFIDDVSDSNNDLQAKVIVLPTIKTSKIDEYTLFIENRRNVLTMLDMIYNQTEISKVRLASMLDISKELANKIMFRYLIVNDFVTPYHSAFKVRENNKVNIAIKIKELSEV